MRAQRAEHLHWFEKSGDARAISDDRNLDHFHHFNGFEVLKEMSFRDCLEVGAGAFTNTRLLGRVTHIERLTVLDPMAETYFSHSESYFVENSLVTVPPWPLIPKVWHYLGTLGKMVARRIFGAVPLKEVVSAPAEQGFGSHVYDLVVMVNVLEHCRDATSVLDNVFAALKPGGFLVFSDKLYPLDGIVSGLTRLYDVAHPLRISREYVRSVIDKHKIIFESEVVDPVSEFFSGTTESYFILQKSAS